MARGKIAAKHSPFRAAPLIGDADFSIADEATNIIVVSVQLKNFRGQALQERAHITGYLSDDAHGDSKTATDPSGTVGGGTDGVTFAPVSEKLFHFISEDDGQFDLSIEEAGVKTCYLVLCMPDGTLKVSDAITFA